MAQEYMPKFGKQSTGKLTEKLIKEVCYGPGIKVVQPVQYDGWKDDTSGKGK